MSKRRPASANPLSPAQPQSEISIWDLATVVLFLCRWIVPAEGMDQGQTLWIVAGWLALAACRFWALWRLGGSFAIPLRPADIGIAALIGGHCVSGVFAWGQGGDGRAALNCCWEWISIGILWLLLKERLLRPEVRRYFCFCLLVTLVTLSGLGIWQHFVWYPQQSRDLTRLLELQDNLDGGRVLDPAARADYSRLRDKFGMDVLSLEEGGRAMLLARTRDSREPIGRFALANSFAALLILGWFLSADLFRQAFVSGARGAIAVSGVVIALVTACLLLTKSRTALIGIAGSLCVMGIGLLLRAKLPRRRLLTWGGLLVAGAVVLALILMSTGGLDRQMLSEAPKSLAYRLEYWQATWEMIQDHPVFGVGPGNFRQNYFAYKLPGASEEVLDPHNLILEVWANGGLLALGGLLLLIGAFAAAIWRMHSDVDGLVSGPTPLSMRAVLCAGVTTFALTGTEEWLLEGFLDRQLIWLALVWLIVAIILGRWMPAVAISPLAACMTIIAVLIHLLGAGGIGMPAILQLLLLLLLMLTPAVGWKQTLSSKTLLGLTGTAGVLLLACLWSGLVPVVTVARLLERGRHEAFVEHRLQLAESHYQLAAQADRLAAAPHDELAALKFERWKRGAGDDEKLFQAAIAEKEAALRRNPKAAKEYWTLSSWWLQRYARHPQPDYARQAVRAAETGVELYPHFVRLQAQLAEAFYAAGDLKKAGEAARVALHLDELNRERQHTDKVLPAALRMHLRSLANSGGNSPAEPVRRQ